MDINNFKTNVAFSILSNGAIAMYQYALADRDLKWLKENAYHVFDFDTQHWKQNKAHAEFKHTMGFPHYYGKDLNAFNDCPGDMYDKDCKGVVLSFRHFDVFSNNEKLFCHHLLDLIALMSRKWLLTGQHLIGIIQSDKPYVFYDKVGGDQSYWNANEWSDKLRINNTNEI